MSSLSRTQYLAHLKVRSGLLNSLEDDTLSAFLDAALRYYSDRLPEVAWDMDTAVVAGQVLYDYPDDAVRIISVRIHGTEQKVLWTTEDQGSGNKVKIGAVVKRSYEHLLTPTYYRDPLNFSTNDRASVSLNTIVHDNEVAYEAFDVEYAKLQTIATISDGALEILPFYVEYLALNLKADDAALAAAEGSSDTPSSISDTNADGSAVSFSFDSPTKVISTLEKRASEKLAQFDQETQVRWGTRG